MTWINIGCVIEWASVYWQSHSSASPQATISFLDTSF